MKLNYETCLLGKKCILVPYRKEHVPKYHEWMKDPSLLEATASEPLSFAEELEMQQSWRDDPNKCTFIVLATEVIPFDDNIISNRTHKEQKQQNEENDQIVVSSIVSNQINAMVGDVNLFLSELEDEEEEDDYFTPIKKPQEKNHDEQQQEQTTLLLQAEIDIMVAEKDYQRKGIGKDATISMLWYGATTIPNISRFFCKIKETNHRSIKLFQTLGFQECNYAACFQEYEYELNFSSLIELKQKLHKNDHKEQEENIDCNYYRAYKYPL